MSRQQTFKISMGCMVDAPIFESHKRGKNWFAVIYKSPDSPGGLGRSFQEKAKGEYFYHIQGLEVNDPIEFGADYYSCGGNPHRKRWFGVIKKITEKSITIKPYDTGIQAINASDRLKENSDEVLLDRKKYLENEILKFKDELIDIDKKLNGE